MQSMEAFITLETLGSEDLKISDPDTGAKYGFIHRLNLSTGEALFCAPVHWDLDAFYSSKDYPNIEILESDLGNSPVGLGKFFRAKLHRFRVEKL